MDRSHWDGNLIRLCFVGLFGVLAVELRSPSISAIIAALSGCFVGLVALAIEIRLKRVSLGSAVGACCGALVGLVLGLLIVSVINAGGLTEPSSRFFRLAVPLFTTYLGLFGGVAKSNLLNLGSFSFLSKTESPYISIKILDTSVLIDGRISEIAEAGFLDGSLIVPHFVLHELQLVADSADTAKRNRGRRGLDVVQRLQKTPRIHLELSAQDFPSIREVDLKLIELGKLQHAKLVTNDFNLNKLAQVQGIEVLNINELANAVRPVVLPGEVMRVFILKEGKEYNQGVAYLDDGTMVVVDNARRCISKTVDITVTSVLQTTAGKMIFGKYDERHLSEQRAATGGSLSTAASAGTSPA